MTELLQQGRVREAAASGAEAAARRALRAQIARLERELGALLADAFPRRGIAFGVGTRAGPRLLSLGELEALRDELAARVADARAALAERHAAEAEARRRLEAMLADPAAHPWERVRATDVGDRGCGEYRVVPRLGPVGVLLRWWRVKVSSGCPLGAAA
jgi:hypothetical protein